MTWTVQDVIDSLPNRGCCDLAPPPFKPISNFERIGMAVKSMAKHTTDEGWQLFQGLESAGYTLCGRGIRSKFEFQAFCETWVEQDVTDLHKVLEYCPSTVVVQDKREWIGRTAGPGFDVRECFTNVSALRDRPDVLKATVLKDAQSDGQLHVEAAEDMGCHAWIVYYHPRIVKRLAPFVRERHLIRTWHSVDAEAVPDFSPRDAPALLSGALGKAYPLRSRIAAAGLPNVAVLGHPGYGRSKCFTPEYLKTLSKFKVAICTCSVYGYALRKLIEATACGCRVITNLPADEALPGGIDENLVRVSNNITMDRLRLLIDHHAERWDPVFQEEMARRAKEFYDFRVAGKRLADDVENLRRNYV